MNAIEHEAPGAATPGHETDAYNAAVMVCLQYNQWSRPRDWPRTEPLLSSLEDAMRALDSLRARDQVNALFVIATALARVQPNLQLLEPLDDYPVSAIGDSPYAEVSWDYVADVQRVATAWRQWLDSTPLTLESLKRALVRARFNALAFQREDDALHFRTAPAGYLIDSALRATRGIGQTLSERTNEASFSAGEWFFPALTAVKDVYEIPGVSPEHRPFRYNEYGTLHYVYMSPEGFDTALSQVAQTVDAMIHDEDQVWEPSSLDVRRFSELAYTLANLLPFPGHGNWGLLYPLLQLILIDHGIEAQQSTGMDLMLMSCESRAVANSYVRAWLEGSWAEQALDYTPNPMKNPLLRYVDPLRCRGVL
jgi:hypothetical protein